MAGPLIPIALMVAGMLAKKQAQNQVDDERDSKLSQERFRQQQLGQEADARMRAELDAQSRPAVEQERGQQTQARQERYDQTAPSVSAETASYLTGASTPKEVKSDLASHITGAIRRGRAASAAQAKLGGMGDTNLRGQFSMARSGQDLNAIGNKSRASSNILPYELQDANQKGEGWRTIGDIADIAGMGYGLYGMTATPNPAGVYSA